MSADRPAHPDDLAQVRHLRRTMSAVVARAAATPDWDHVRARVESGGAPPASLDRRRGRAGWLAIAAAVVVVAAIGAALVAARQDGDQDQVQTTQFPQGSPGGWYVPRGLPTGWKPFRITSSVDTRFCLCRSAVWREVGGDGWVQFRTEAFAPGSTVEATDPAKLTIDLGSGFKGAVMEHRGVEAQQVGDWELAWNDQHHYGGVSGSGLSSDQAAAIARAMVADPARRTIPVDGARYELASDAVSQDDMVIATIQVEMRRPDGGTAIYALRPPSTYEDESPTADWNRVDLPGQDLPVETWTEQSYTGPSHGYRPWTNFRGQWEGADVHAPTSANVTDGAFSPSSEQVATLVASLRPATVEQWRAFVRTAKEHSKQVLEIESVSDLLPVRTPAPTTTEVATGPNATSTSTATSTTALGGTPTSTSVPPNDRLQGEFPDGASWSVERDPEHGLCAVLAETNVGCDDVGPVVPADADPSTVRWGLTDERWLAFAVLPEDATGVVITPVGDAPPFGTPRLDLTNRLWAVGGSNPEKVFAVNELYRVQYRMADGTLVDAPTAE